MVTSFVESKSQFLKSVAKVLSMAISLSLGLVSIAQASQTKISWEDFDSSQIPPRTRELPPQTPISFVVDTNCAAEKIRYLRPGGLLNSVLSEGAKRAYAIEEYTVGVELNSAVSFDLVEQEVSQEKCVQSAGYDGAINIMQTQKIKPARATDPGRPRQGHLSYLRFEQALASLEPALMVRKPVTIAVIDAGIDMNHPDLAVGAWRNMKEVAGNGRDDDRNGYVDDVIGYNFGSDIGNPAPQISGLEGAHGTHVAGLAAARWRNGVGGTGVGVTAKIMSINVFGEKRTTRSSIVENAIRYAGRNGADIINLSLSGGEFSRTMPMALRYAVSRGSFIVAATGNEGLKFNDSPSDGFFISPAGYGGQISGMISVASIDVESGSLSRFSNFNPTITQLAAPGSTRSFGEPVGLYSTFPRNSYSSLSGTSMATPLVSGAAALVIGYLKACGVSVSPSRVESILINGSRQSAKLLPYVRAGKELDLSVLASYLRSIKTSSCK